MQVSVDGAINPTVCRHDIISPFSQRDFSVSVISIYPLLGCSLWEHTHEEAGHTNLYSIRCYLFILLMTYAVLEQIKQRNVLAYLQF